MATEATILANRRKAQVMVLSFLRRQESRVLVGPGFRIKCGMTAQKVPTKSCAFMQNKANFLRSQVNVNLYNTTDYEEKSNWTFGENKPNSNPIKPNLYLTAENAEYAEKKDIFVSGCPIEKYALYPISPCSLRTWRLMENKPKQTQFPKSQKMNANAFLQKDYENETTLRPQQNKPNQSQSQKQKSEDRRRVLLENTAGSGYI